MGIFTAYTGEKPFGFISYSHADIVKVEHIYNILRRQGIRIWYDDMGNGIKLGEKWNEVIDERLKKSSVFVCFLANGVENRSEVIREILLANELKKANEAYKMIFVFLERVPLNSFPKEVADLIRNSQFVSLYKFGGITEAFIKRLVSHQVWSAACVDDNERRKNGFAPWSESENEEIEFEDYDENGIYVYDQAMPHRVEFEGKYYYRISKNEIDKGTVYPICIDNQWCPEEYLNNPQFIENGFREDSIRNAIVKRQTSEVVRALLHNLQIVVNRATVQNSAVFLQWYINYNGQLNEEEHKAFCELLRDGSIVICLFGEENPWGRADYQINDRADYDKLCMDNEVFCLRLDWDNETNKYLINKNLAAQFHNTCIVLPEFEMDFIGLCKVFGINDKEKQQEFRDVWKNIQKEVLDYSHNENKLFSRQKFYERFIIKEGTKAEHSIIDPDKPFSAELKQIIDYIYCTNLPKALGIQTIIPDDSRIKVYDETSLITRGAYREITIDELCCAIEEYLPGFVGSVYDLPVAREYTIDEVYKVRKLSKWKRYVNTVVSGRKRATENEIDFYDIDQTWKYYSQAIAEMKKKQLFPEKSWEAKPMVLSVIYTIGNSRIEVIYGDGLTIRTSSRKNLIQSSGQNAIITVYYTFSDVSSKKTGKNPFFTSRCLFRGIVIGNEKTVFDRIYDGLKSKKSRMEAK